MTKKLKATEWDAIAEAWDEEAGEKGVWHQQHDIDPVILEMVGNGTKRDIFGGEHRENYRHPVPSSARYLFSVSAECRISCQRPEGDRYQKEGPEGSERRGRHAVPSFEIYYGCREENKRISAQRNTLFLGFGRGEGRKH